MKISGIDIYIVTHKGKILDPYTTLKPIWQHLRAVTEYPKSYEQFLRDIPENGEFSYDGFVIRKRELRTKYQDK